MTNLYKNPYYETHSPKWRFYKDLYDGDHQTLVTSYLWKHESEKKPEGKDLLQTRQERTRYLNLSEISISLLRSLFFRKSGSADDVLAELAGEDLTDIDRKGKSLDSFLSEDLFYSYINYGAVCLLADAPAQQAGSAAEESSRGLRPYLKNIDPLDVHDWSFEQDDPARVNRLNFLRYVYLKDLARFEEEEPRRVIYSDAYRVQDGRVFIRRYQGQDFKNSGTEQWEFKEEIPLPLKEIPAVLWFGTSWMKDASQEILRHFNLRSALDNVNHYQGYQKLFIKGGTSMSDDQRKALSEYIMGLLGDGQDVVSIDALDPIGLEKAVNQAREDALKSALNQLRSLPADSKESMSQDASIEARRDTTNLVREAIEELEDIFNQGIQHYAAFKDRRFITSKFEGRYELNRDVLDLPLSELVMAIPSLAQAFASNPEWEKAHYARLVRAFDYPTNDQIEILKTLQASRRQTLAERPNLLGNILNGG